MKKVKILFLSHDTNLSGAERSLLILLKALDKNKYSLLVVLPCNGPLKEKIEDAEIKTIIYPIQRWIPYDSEYGKSHFRECFGQMPGRIQFLTNLIKEEKIDLVYTNTITCIDGAIAAKIRKLPHIWHIREILLNDTSLKPYFPIFFINIIINTLSSKIIVVSKAVKRALIKDRDGKYEGKMRVIYNASDPDESMTKKIRYMGHDSLSELLSEKKTKIVASLGSIKEKKGQIDLIKAAKIVTDCFKNIVFILIGDGDKEYIDKLKEIVRENSLEKKVYFFDFCENTSSIYESIDILVSSALVEPFGRTIIEAMAAGKPVVATKCGGPEEIIEEGKTGFLVPIKSPKELARAIIELIHNPELAKNMGESGRKRANSLFNLERHIFDIENVIDNAVR